MSMLSVPVSPALTSVLNLGINNVTNTQYHSDRTYLSSSVIKTLCKSLDQYRIEYLEGNKPPHSDRTLSNFSEGSYVHSRILEPHLTDSEFAIFEGWRKQGAEFETFKANNSDKTIMSAPQIERCNRMMAAYNRMLIANNMIKGGASEQTICAILQDVPVKVRFDYINPERGYIVDVKTTGYGSDIDSFKSTIKDFSYDLSAALYTKVAEEFYGRKFDFYFLVLSKRDFDCNLYLTSEDTQAKGYRQVTEGLNKFKRAVKSGIWTEGSNNLRPQGPELITDYQILSV